MNLGPGDRVNNMPDPSAFPLRGSTKSHAKRCKVKLAGAGEAAGWFGFGV